MNWDSAKNLIILFLCMLNIFIFVMYNMQHNQYTLSPEQEKAIFTILAQNKISMYTRIPREYTPMRPIQMAGYTYDEPHLMQVFFGGEKGVVRRDEPSKTVYNLYGISLTNQNGYLTYENGEGFDASALAATKNTAGYVASLDDAASLCGRFIERLYDSPFILEEQWEEEDGYTLVYRSLYDETVIYSNFIRFQVSADGIVQAETMYSHPQGYKGRALEVCSADEALFTFTQQVKQAYSGREVFVDKMEFAYYQAPSREDTAPEKQNNAAIPCYRISVWRQDMPQEVDYIINAYTNTIIT